MNMIKNYFPLAFSAKADVTALVINIVIHIVVGFVAGLVIGLLASLPLVGIIFSLIGWVVELYMTASVILSLLDYFKVLK